MTLENSEQPEGQEESAPAAHEATESKDEPPINESKENPPEENQQTEREESQETIAAQEGARQSDSEAKLDTKDTQEDVAQPSPEATTAESQEAENTQEFSEASDSSVQQSEEVSQENLKLEADQSEVSDREATPEAQDAEHGEQPFITQESSAIGSHFDSNQNPEPEKQGELDSSLANNETQASPEPSLDSTAPEGPTEAHESMGADGQLSTYRGC